MRKIIAIPMASVLVAATMIGIVATSTTPSKSGASTSPVVQTLANHETRIKNAENNIKDLQAKTGTPDSSSNAPVPDSTPVTDSNVSQGVTQQNPITTSTVTSPSPALTTATDTTTSSPTVTSFREIVIDADNSDCEYTYSDGSTYQFHWKTSGSQDAWVTDGVGQNGHWVKTHQLNGFCSERAIGQPKG